MLDWQCSSSWFPLPVHYHSSKNVASSDESQLLAVAHLEFCYHWPKWYAAATATKIRLHCIWSVIVSESKYQMWDANVFLGLRLYSVPSQEPLHLHSFVIPQLMQRSSCWDVCVVICRCLQAWICLAKLSPQDLFLPVLFLLLLSTILLALSGGPYFEFPWVICNMGKWFRRWYLEWCCWWVKIMAIYLYQCLMDFAAFAGIWPPYFIFGAH